MQCTPVEEAVDDPVLGDRQLTDIPVRHTFSYPDDFDFRQTQEGIRSAWGEPDDVLTERVQGTGARDDADNVRETLVYDGFEFVFFEEGPDQDSEEPEQALNVMAATVLKTPEVAIDNGLRVGMLHADVADILGRPIFTQGASYVYSFGDSPTDTMNIELVVRGDRVSEIAVSPDFP
ncbi:MAG: hypothetical protein ACOC4I_06645 [Spirochaetota bacterium]